ncbi:MAG: DNA gyrase inhibitor YacG [Methylocella sp.]
MLPGDDEDAAGPPSSAAPSARPCPICGKPAVEKMRPFCSKRCADVDLHRWLGGVYAIPAGEADDDSKDDAPDEDGL